MRLIDADALKSAMYHEAFETDSEMQKWDSGCWIRYKMFEKAIETAPTIEAESVVRCKDCRHFCIKDHFGNFNGVPILGASDVPTCDAWANTECMVKPDGYCFMAERREEGKRREL